MSLVVDKFRALLPPRSKNSPSGWTSFNAPCCHHRGHSQDTRKRGGVRFDQGIIYNCFNCKFTASWQPGRQLNEKFRTLCRWMGANDDDIKQMVFEALKTESQDYDPEITPSDVVFEARALPEGSMPLAEWANYLEDLPPDLQQWYVEVVEYVIDRGFDPYSGDFWWSITNGYESRVLLPFSYKGKVYGSTARKVNDGKPKYLSDHPPHIVFNTDRQTEDQRYIFVVEGPFDALSIDGVALLTNDIADQQARIINGLGNNIIVIPDQDEAGLQLIRKAMHYNWSVAFPTWDKDIKDCADAVQKYGKLFVMVDAIKTAVKGDIKITMAMKQLEKRL